MTALHTLREIARALGLPESTVRYYRDAFSPYVPAAAADGGLSRDEVVALLFDGERERRDVMWQMVREIVRLGEAVERQHAILAGIFERVVDGERRALPAAPAPELARELEHELGTLREELARERELVERLRTSKLELERRAADAEARVEQRAVAGGSVLSRLLSRAE